MPSGVYKHHLHQGFQEGNKFYDNLYSKENWLKKGEGLKEKHLRWKGGIKTNRELRNEYNRNYRQRRGKKYIQFCNHKRKLLVSDLTPQIIQQVYEDNIKKFGTLTCYLCLNPIVFGKDTLEHKQPLARGGTNEYSNLAIACQRCNCKKHAKTEKEYRIKYG